MKKNFYEQLKEELNELQKEWKIEDIKIEEIEDDFDEEVIEAIIPIQRKMKCVNLKKGLTAAMIALTMSSVGLSTMPNIVTNNTATTVEAASKKKDKKKPKFTFKGKTTMTVTKGKSVKIPKVTAKDNKDGNVTKKIKVTVKKGKKSDKSLASKIKANKSVKFKSIGKYVITYTVTDKAGNKATKKRYVIVKEASKTKNTTTEENKTTETSTSENKTTETPTTEVPTTESPATEKITIDGNTYNITKDMDFYNQISSSNEKIDNPSINLNFENDYFILYFDVESGLTTDYQYLKYFGKITATDANGNDISDKVIISVNPDLLYKNGNSFTIHVYVKDSSGNVEVRRLGVFLRTEESMKASEDLQIKISDDPLVYTVANTTVSYLSKPRYAKILKYTDC